MNVSRCLLRTALLLSLGVHAFACGAADPNAPAPSTVAHAEPPARPDVVSTGGTTRWFAMRKVYLGTVDPVTGQSSHDAWRGIGFDLDHRVTTADDSKNNR